MFATAIIGKTVGKKYDKRKNCRPAILSLTHNAIPIDKAIETVMAALAKQPPAPVKRPAYPVYKR